MQIIVLAAGKGSRMRSTLPKLMHEVGGKPMLERVIDNCYAVSHNLILVYSNHIEKFLSKFEQKCQMVYQAEQLGTAHAVFVAKHKFIQNQPIAVIYGDNPLITPEIIKNLFDSIQNSDTKIVTLAFRYDKPNAYGKIIVDSNDKFQRIVEAKFATEEEQKITLCNSGIMVFAAGILERYIEDCLKPNPDYPGRELYLTDIIEIAGKNNEKVSYYISKNYHAVLGVNTQTELQNANLIIDKK